MVQVSSGYRRRTQSSTARMIGWGALLTVVGLAGLFFWRHLSARRLEQCVQRGLLWQQSARDDAQLADSLQRWEDETGEVWRDRRERLVRYIFDNHGIQDPRVRRLLTWITGADFGDRLEDWKRWMENRDRLRAGRPPLGAGKSAVMLNPVWSAPVGLTTWFSTILPIDGSLYVASLGTSFDNPDDPADGVIRVDGRTGESRYLFDPPDRAPRDILGLAAGDGVLFVACRNGMVYCIDFEGTLKWKASAGAAIASVPVALAAQRRDQTDVLIASETGRVQLLDGASGKPVWVVELGPLRLGGVAAADAATMPRPPLGVSFAVGDFLRETGPEILVTTAAGDQRVLSASSGRTRWQSGGAGRGGVSGAIALGATTNLALEALRADLAGGVWMLQSDRGLHVTPLKRLLASGSAGVVAPLRTIAGDPARNEIPTVIACLAGVPGRTTGALAAIDRSGVAWQYPLGGIAWAAPAVADLSGDMQPEIVATSFSVAPSTAGAWLTVLSSDGRCVKEIAFAASIESAPLVADVNGDGLLEVLVADRAGMLHCFETRRVGPVEWGLPGGDIRNSRNASQAFSYSQTPFGYQAKWRP